MTVPAGEWLERRWRQHRRLAAGLTVLVILAGAALGPIPLPAQVAVLVLVVALLGLPHGAADVLVARRAFRPRLGRIWQPLFAVAYLGPAAGVIVLWWQAPLVALAGFLLIAIWHFGEGDAPAPVGAGRCVGRAMSIMLHGALPVAAPIVLRPAEVAVAFAALIPGHGAETVTATLTWLGVPLGVLLAALPAWLAIAWLRGRDMGERQAAAGSLGESLLLIGLFAALPPPLAFAAYFGLWHAPRHSLELAAALDPADPARGLADSLRAAIGPTLMTIAAATAAWLVLAAHGPPTAAALQTVFIGLAALTVPHMLLEPAVARLGAAIARESVSA